MRKSKKITNDSDSITLEKSTTTALLKELCYRLGVDPTDCIPCDLVSVETATLAALTSASFIGKSKIRAIVIGVSDTSSEGIQQATVELTGDESHLFRAIAGIHYDLFDLGVL